MCAIIESNKPVDRLNYCTHPEPRAVADRLARGGEGRGQKTTEEEIWTAYHVKLFVAISSSATFNPFRTEI